MSSCRRRSPWYSFTSSRYTSCARPDGGTNCAPSSRWLKAIASKARPLRGTSTHIFTCRSAMRRAKMWVEVPRSGRAFDAIAFNHLEEGAQFVPPSGLAQLVYRLEVNEYQG